MKKYVYACFELKIELKDAVAQIKIPFSSRKDAIEYIYAHADASFHSKAWLE